MTFAQSNGAIVPVILTPGGGVPTADAALAEIIDQTTSTVYAYHCEAAPGALSSAALWRISRLTLATGVLQWADGNAQFDNIADNRATTQVYA